MTVLTLSHLRGIGRSTYGAEGEGVDSPRYLEPVWALRYNDTPARALRLFGDLIIMWYFLDWQMFKIYFFKVNLDLNNFTDDNIIFL